MTIRTRLTIWFAAVLASSLFAMGALSYYGLVVEPRNKARLSPTDPEAKADPPGEELLEALAWSGGPAVVLGLGGGWWLMRRALAPVAALTQAAEHINEHSLNKPLMRTGNGDELDRLTGDISVNLESCEPTRILGDRHRLRQLLLNLTDNAIKYNQPRGCVTLSVTHSGQSAEISIANTGPGIKPELLPRVFDPFFRGDASHSQIVEGCGLGLSIARWIVTAHDGAITISSRPAEMTVTTVRLPMYATEGKQ